MATSTAAMPVSFPGRGGSPLNTRALPFVKLAVLLSSAVGHVFAAPLADALGSNDTYTVAGHGGGEDEAPARTGLELTISMLSIAGLVLLGGIFAGLTLALMGLDELHLQVLSSSGTDLERARASKVLRLLSKGKHWVLVVLLLGNVIVNETLPIFLSDFGGGLAAVFTSTLLIVIFGEIVPQSVCARYGLAIGAFCAPLVHMTMLLFAPVAWPTAKFLDWCLGEDHGTAYRKAELKTFVTLHQTLGAENLSEDEVTIIRAVLDLNEKSVKDVMTPIADVFTLSADTILDDEGVIELVNSGYSRVPVYEPGKPDAIHGMLLVKKLISYDPEDARPVSFFNLSPLPEASPDLTLLDCLNFFQGGSSHMLLVSENPGQNKGALGVVTLEDIVEEMIGEEIIDETDIYVDVQNKIQVERKKDTQQGPSSSLGPLIRDVMAKRKPGNAPVRAPLRSKYGAPSSTASKTPATGGGTRAMDKVMIKRPGSPTPSESAATLASRTNGAGAANGSNGGAGGNASFSPRIKAVEHFVKEYQDHPDTGNEQDLNISISPRQEGQEASKRPFIVERGPDGTGPSIVFHAGDLPEDPGAEERARRQAEAERQERERQEREGGAASGGKKDGQETSEGKGDMMKGVRDFFGGKGS